MVMGRAPPAAGEWHRGTASAVPLNLVLPPVVLAAAWPPVVIIFDYKRKVGNVALWLTF